jgi:hypothetical protein
LRFFGAMFRIQVGPNGWTFYVNSRPRNGSRARCKIGILHGKQILIINFIVIYSIYIYCNICIYICKISFSLTLRTWWDRRVFSNGNRTWFDDIIKHGTQHFAIINWGSVPQLGRVQSRCTAAVLSQDERSGSPFGLRWFDSTSVEIQVLHNHSLESPWILACRRLRG